MDKISKMREEHVKLLDESLKQIVKKLENKVGKIRLFEAYSLRKDLFSDLDILVIDYYIPTRYPNALPGSIPSKIFNRKSANEALNLANNIINLVKKFIVKEQKKSHLIMVNYKGG